MHVDEAGGIGDDAAQESFILLVTTQLRLPIIFSGDEDVVEVHHLAEHFHAGMETHLPAAVLHRFRHDDLELQVHTSVPLGHIAETRRHAGGLQRLAGYHLSAGFIAHGVHYHHLVPFEIVDYQSILLQAGHVDFPERCTLMLREGQRCCNLLFLQLPRLAGRSAGAD